LRDNDFFLFIFSQRKVVAQNVRSKRAEIESRRDKIVNSQSSNALDQISKLGNSSLWRALKVDERNCRVACRIIMRRHR
jgi:hypothetical protein